MSGQGGVTHHAAQDNRESGSDRRRGLRFLRFLGDQSAGDGQRRIRGARLFVGLWEGIDPLDGSFARLSITCDQDGVCEILVAETAFTFCDGSSDGLGRGTGSIDAGVLEVPDFTLSCFATGTVIDINPKYTPDFGNGTLVQEGDTPGVEPIVYHKVSLPTW